MKSLPLSIVPGVALVLSGNAGQSVDPPATHGMAVFGNETVYLSHLPMFHSPHDYQAIFQARLDPVGLAAYEDPRKNPSGAFYTLEPQEFVLPDLAAEAASRPVTVSARLFTGIFDEDGTAISPDFPVQITNVLYFRKFIPGEAKPAHPTYLLFGDTGSGVYLAHVIHAAPDFDQILEVGSVGPELEARIAPDVPLTVVFPEIEGDNPLPEQAQLSISAPGLTDTVEVERQVYFDSGDLQ